MKKVLLGLIFLPLVVSDFNSTNVETVVRNEATGENASVHTEVTNVVNQKEVTVESNEPGEIKVEVKNGEVKIESTPIASPQVTIVDMTEEEKDENQDEGKSEEEEVISQMEEIQTKIISFFENFFARLRDSLIFWR